MEPLANALHAWRLAGGTASSRVGILGGGGIGLAMLLVAKHFVASVTVADLLPGRLAVAKRLGADKTGQELDSSFEIIVDAVGATATRRASLSHLQPAGTAVWLGLLDPSPDFDALDFIRTEKRVIGSFAYSHEDFAGAVSFVPQVDLSWVTVFDLSEGPTIFTQLMTGRSDVIKALLCPHIPH